MNRLKRYYGSGIVILAIISISLVLLDLFNFISIESSPFIEMENSILVVFAIDYLYRFYKAKDKKLFVYSNIFDLLSIIPLNSFFAIFRIGRAFRVVRLTKVLRLTRLIGLTGKLQTNVKRFFNTNGFKYLLYTSSSLMLFSSLLYSFAESVSFTDSLWWAISTATTVGYGDIYPSTALGKFAAVLLMVLGIGFIGMLTGSITSYFTKAEELASSEKFDELNAKLDYLIEKISLMENRD